MARHARLYDQAARLAKLGAWECRLDTEELTWTGGVYDLFELEPFSRVRRAETIRLYEDESRCRMEFLRAEAIRGGGSFVVDAQIRTHRGASRWMRLSADVAFEDGRPVRIFGAKQDITQERESWAHLRQLADRDPLTGLANRRVFDARYRDLAGGGSGEGAVSALVLIDLDHFKQVNDRLGHLAGDECLREVAGRLCRAFGEAVLVARIGGDEFAVLLGAPLGRLQILHLLQRALRSLNRPVLWNGARIDIGASIGVTILGRPHRRKLPDLFREADGALYAAKTEGRGRIRIFGDPDAAAADGSPGPALRYA